MNNVISDKVWNLMVENLNICGLTKVLIENCILESWENDECKLLLAPSQKPLLNQQHMQRIEQALSELTQRNITLSIAVAPVPLKLKYSQIFEINLKVAIIDNGKGKLIDSNIKLIDTPPSE